MAAERAAGSAVLCPGCGNRFTAGGAEPPAAEAPRAADTARPAGKSRPPRRAVIVVAVAALVCAAAAAWTYRGPPRETPPPQEPRPPQPAMQEYLRQEEMLEKQTRVFTRGGAGNPANRPAGWRGTGRVRK
jgi:hypothetical protein